MFENKSIKEVWDYLESTMNSNPEPIKGLNLIYQYDITGEDSGKYQLHFSNDSALVVEGETNSADCTLKLSDKNFKKMVLGNLNGTAAFMTGKLKVQGSMGLALKLESILNEYKVSELA